MKRTPCSAARASARSGRPVTISAARLPRRPPRCRSLLPGLSQLAASPSLGLQRTFLLHRPIVFLQDAPLKLRALGSAWADLYPRLKAITAHADWPPFEAEVLARHEAGERLLMQSLRSSAASPDAYATLQREVAQLREAQADNKAQLARMMHEQEDNIVSRLAGLLEQHAGPSKRALDGDPTGPKQPPAKRVCPPSPPPAEPSTPPRAAEAAETASTMEPVAASCNASAGFTFKLEEFVDLQAAFEAFQRIEKGSVKGARQWQGDKKEAKSIARHSANSETGWQHKLRHAVLRLWKKRRRCTFHRDDIHHCKAKRVIT